MLLCLAGVTPAMAQFNLKKAVGGAVKAAKAVTLTDEQMTEYVKEYIDWMDKHNQVCADDDPYTVRLKKLTEGLTEVEGMPLNFKVYYVIDVNAFACADGSVRVFSSLMDIMTDEALDEVIELYSDTTGIRDLEQAAEHIAANALYQIEVDHVKSVTFDAEMVRNLLK